MALTAADLREPRGEIEPSMFPLDRTIEALEERLEEYLMEGYSRAAALTGAAADDAARQWVYYRAYRAVYLRLSTNPESVQFEDAGGHRYGEEQAPRFLRLANQARGEFDVLLSRAADSVLRFQQGSRAVPTVFEW